MSGEKPTELDVLKEILKWTKFAGLNQAQSVLENTLKTPEERLAYQLSDGAKGQLEVGKLSQVGSNFKVGELWKTWRRKGLGDSVNVKGGERFRRTFDLEDFGIEFPPVKLSTSPQSIQPQQLATSPAVEPVADESTETDGQ